MSRETLKAAMDSAKSAKDSAFSNNSSAVAPVALLKTAYSKNITIEEWNQLVVDVGAVLQELDSEDALVSAIYSTTSWLCDDIDDYYDLKTHAFTGYVANQATADPEGHVFLEYYAVKTDVAAFENVLTGMLKAAGYDYYDTSVRAIFDAEVGTRTEGVFAKLNAQNTFAESQTFDKKATFNGIIGISRPGFAFAINDGPNLSIFKLPNIGNSVARTLAITLDVDSAKEDVLGALDYEIVKLTTKIEEGAVVALQATQAKYAVGDKRGIDIYENYVRKDDIVNDLFSSATNLPLSAYQGQVIYQMIQAINDMLSSDDVNLNEIQEIVTYIKSNKSLIDQITIDKVSFSDIIDDLTSNVQSKPLSAAQGYALKNFIDGLQSSKVNVSDIVDTLVSTAANKPLSANQGRALKALIDALDVSLASEKADVSALISELNANEMSRVSAENARDSAESARASAETTRQSNETTRQSNESSRASAESSRASAETARASAETSRASAETARATAESGRVMAEQGRVSAEEARVAAEAERASEFSGFQDEIDSKLTRGTYDGSTGVGYSDETKSISTKVGNEDKTPSSFGTCGGSADIETGMQKLNKLVGASIVNNQLVKNGDFSVATGIQNWDSKEAGIGITGGKMKIYPYTNKGENGIYQAQTWLVGHLYLIMVKDIDLSGLTINEGYNVAVYLRYDGASAHFITRQQAITDTSTKISWNLLTSFTANMISEMYGDPRISVSIGHTANQISGTFTIGSIQVIDLTLRYGSNDVVDAIIGTTGTDADKFSRLLKFDPDILKDLSYDAGSFVNSKSAKLKCVDYNQWDEQWQLGSLDNDTGANSSNSSRIRSKGYIRAFPSTQYYFKHPENSMCVFYYDINKNLIEKTVAFTQSKTYTTPSNCAFMRFWHSGTTYNNDICIFIYWDGSRIGYEPYEEHITELPNKTLHGILKVDANGQVYADGDELYPDGTGETRYVIVDLGTFDWNVDNLASEQRVYIASPSPAPKAVSNNNNKANAICQKFDIETYTHVNSTPENYDEVIAISSAGYIQLRSTSLLTGLTTRAQVQSALSGIYFIYPLATTTPLTDQGAFSENVFMDDFGNMRFLDENGNEIAGLQGAEIFYKANVAGYAESLYVKTDGSVDSIPLKSEVLNLSGGSRTIYGSVSFKASQNASEIFDISTDDNGYNVKLTSRGTNVLMFSGGSLYYREKLLPGHPSSSGDYVFKSVSGAYSWKQDSAPNLASDAADGTYVLKAVKSGSTITYQWVLENE